MATPTLDPMRPKASSSSSTASAASGKPTRYPVYPPPPPSLSPRKSVSTAQTREQRRSIVPSTPLRSPSLACESTPLLSSRPSQKPRLKPQAQFKGSLVPQIPPRHSDLPKPGQSSKGALEQQRHDRRPPSGWSKPPPLSIVSRDPPRPRPTPEPSAAPVPAKKKPFYRPRPLWLVPFAVLAALVRGMTLAPRVEVYTQLACYSLYPPQPSGKPIPPSVSPILDIQWSPSSAISLYSSLDPLGPHLFPAPQIQRDRISRPSNSSSDIAIPIALSSHSSLSSSASPSSSSGFLSKSLSESFDGAPVSAYARDPRALPSHRCLTDPAVQASAARLQTLMTTTMGLLSALTTASWGRFSQTHGRTKVLAISTFGLFFTDLVFILTSTPNLPWPLSLLAYSQPGGIDTGSWARYKHHLLLLGPIVEGALGGWTTLQSATSAYISDCTSVGSRAGVFSRFTGVFYVGFSVGPMIAGYVVRHPELFSWWPSPSSSGHRKKAGLEGLLEIAKQRPATASSVTTVFWVAIACSFINFLLVLFVFPESLDKEKMQKAAAAAVAQANEDAKGKGRMIDEDHSPLSPLLPIVEDVEGVGGGDGFIDVEELQSPISPTASHSARSHRLSISSSVRPEVHSAPTRTSLLSNLIQPLAVFFPVAVTLPTRNALLLKRQRDWSLTLLALGLAGWMLSTGVYQIKYLYAEHVYGWGAEELSLYISWMGAVRAAVLLWGVPAVVGWLKGRVAEMEVKEQQRDVKGKQRAVEQEEEGPKKSPLTRLQLGQSIRFDLRLARASLFVDLVSNLLIAITPSPAFHAESLKYYFNSRIVTGQQPMRVTHEQSQAMFVAASSLSAFGGGLVPAVHSLALCIVQARALEPDFGITGYGVRDADGVVEPIVHEDWDVEGYGATAGSRASSVASSAFGPQGRAFSTNTLAQHSTPAVVDSGTLFGAFAVLQALGQMIIGPMLFGLVYSSTVARYPKAVFIVSSALLLCSFAALLAVRNPVGEVRVERRARKFRERMDRSFGSPPMPTTAEDDEAIKKAAERQRKALELKRRKWELDMERRGRPVRSKDLRGGAIGRGVSFSYGSFSGMGTGVSPAEPGLLSQSYREERALVTRSA